MAQWLAARSKFQSFERSRLSLFRRTKKFSVSDSFWFPLTPLISYKLIKLLNVIRKCFLVIETKVLGHSIMEPATSTWLQTTPLISKMASPEQTTNIHELERNFHNLSSRPNKQSIKPNTPSSSSSSSCGRQQTKLHFYLATFFFLPPHLFSLYPRVFPLISAHDYDYALLSVSSRRTCPEKRRRRKSAAGIWFSVKNLHARRFLVVVRKRKSM